MPNRTNEVVILMSTPRQRCANGLVNACQRLEPNAPGQTKVILLRSERIIAEGPTPRSRAAIALYC